MSVSEEAEEELRALREDNKRRALAAKAAKAEKAKDLADFQSIKRATEKVRNSNPHFLEDDAIESPQVNAGGALKAEKFKDDDNNDDDVDAGSEGRVSPSSSTAVRSVGQHISRKLNDKDGAAQETEEDIGIEFASAPLTNTHSPHSYGASAQCDTIDAVQQAPRWKRWIGLGNRGNRVSHQPKIKDEGRDRGWNKSFDFDDQRSDDKAISTASDAASDAGKRESFKSFDNDRLVTPSSAEKKAARKAKLEEKRKEHEVKLEERRKEAVQRSKEKEARKAARAALKHHQAMQQLQHLKKQEKDLLLHSPRENGGSKSSFSAASNISSAPAKRKKKSKAEALARLKNPIISSKAEQRRLAAAAAAHALKVTGSVDDEDDEDDDVQDDVHPDDALSVLMLESQGPTNKIGESALQRAGIGRAGYSNLGGDNFQGPPLEDWEMFEHLRAAQASSAMSSSNNANKKHDAINGLLGEFPDGAGGGWSLSHARALQRWVSSKVEPRGFFVQDLFRDLRDGSILHVLLAACFENFEFHAENAAISVTDRKQHKRDEEPKSEGTRGGSRRVKELEKPLLPALPRVPRAGLGHMQHAASVKLVIRWLCVAFGQSAGFGVGKLPPTPKPSTAVQLSSSLSLDEQLGKWAQALASSSDSSAEEIGAAGFGIMEFEEGDDDEDNNDSDDNGCGAMKDASGQSQKGNKIGKEDAHRKEYYEAERRLESIALRVVVGESGATLNLIWSIAQCWAMHACLPHDPSVSMFLFGGRIATQNATEKGEIASYESREPRNTDGEVQNNELLLRGGLASYPLAATTSACFVHQGLKEWLLCWYSCVVQEGFQKNVPSVLLRPIEALRGGKNQRTKEDEEEDDEEDDEEDSEGDQDENRFRLEAQCPGKHTLKPFPTTNNSWWCSACSRHVRRKTIMKGCRLCDYDLCLDCFEKLRTEPQPPTAAEKAARRARRISAAQQRRCAAARAAASTARMPVVGSIFSLGDESTPPSLLAALAALTGSPPVDRRAYFGVKSQSSNSSSKGGTTSSAKAPPAERGGGGGGGSGNANSIMEDAHSEHIDLLVHALAGCAKQLNMPILIDPDSFPLEEISLLFLAELFAHAPINAEMAEKYRDRGLATDTLRSHATFITRPDSNAGSEVFPGRVHGASIATADASLTSILMASAAAAAAAPMAAAFASSSGIGYHDKTSDATLAAVLSSNPREQISSTATSNASKSSMWSIVLAQDDTITSTAAVPTADNDEENAADDEENEANASGGDGDMNNVDKSTERPEFGPLSLMPAGSFNAHFEKVVLTVRLDPFWRLRAVEKQFAAVLRRERSQRKSLTVSRRNVENLKQKVTRLRMQKLEGTQRAVGLEEEVTALEGALEEAKHEALVAKQSKECLSKQIKGLSDSNTAFVSQLSAAEAALAQAEERERARLTSEAAALKEHAEFEAAAAAAAAAVVPKGSLTVTVCVLGAPVTSAIDGIKDEEPDYPKEVQSTVRAGKGSDLVATTLSSSPPKRLLYVVNGSLPVSWLLSQVLRDCDERADIVGLCQRPRQQQIKAKALQERRRALMAAQTKDGAKKTSQESKAQEEASTGQGKVADTKGDSDAAGDTEGDSSELRRLQVLWEASNQEPANLDLMLQDLSADLRECVHDGDTLDVALSSQILKGSPARRRRLLKQSKGALLLPLTPPASALSQNGSASREILKESESRNAQTDSRQLDSALFPLFPRAMSMSSSSYALQRDVLTNWINHRIATRRCFVSSLFEDLSDGLILKHLLELITGEDLDEYSCRRPDLSHRRSKYHHQGFYFPARASSDPCVGDSGSCEVGDEDTIGGGSGGGGGGGVGLGIRRKARGVFNRLRGHGGNPAQVRESGYGNDSDEYGNLSPVFPHSHPISQLSSTPELSRIEQLHNMSILFEFMRERNVIVVTGSAAQGQNLGESDGSGRELQKEEGENNNDDDDEALPEDIVDGNPRMILQVVYAVVNFALLQDWGLSPPQLLGACRSDSGGDNNSSAFRKTSSLSQLFETRRLENWRCLYKVLISFVSSRICYFPDIELASSRSSSSSSSDEGRISTGKEERFLKDLGPSLIDGKVLLALLHSADPISCPYDPDIPDDLPPAQAKSGPSRFSNSSAIATKALRDPPPSTATRALAPAVIACYERESNHSGNSNGTSGRSLNGTEGANRDADVQAIAFQQNRRRAFARANIHFACPPLLSDSGASTVTSRAVRTSRSSSASISRSNKTTSPGHGAALVVNTAKFANVGGGVGSELGATAFQFENLGMIYLSELCIRLARCSRRDRHARVIPELLEELSLSSRRERQATLALARADRVRRDAEMVQLTANGVDTPSNSRLITTLGRSDSANSLSSLNSVDSRAQQKNEQLLKLLEAAEARAEELKVKNARLLESLETSERQKSATRAADSESSGFEAKLEIAKAVAVVEAAKEKEKAADIAALKSKYDDLLRHSHSAQISAEKEASTLAKDLEKAKAQCEVFAEALKSAARVEEKQRSNKALKNKLCIIQKNFAELSTKTESGNSSSFDCMKLKSALTEMRTAWEYDISQLQSAISGISVARKKESAVFLEELKSAHRERRRALNNLLELRGNIRVLCRVRPISSSPSSEALQEAAETASGSATTRYEDPASSFMGPHGGTPGVVVDTDGMTIRVTSSKTGLERSWRFPRVFPLDVTQSEVFEEIEPMIHAVLDGYNATIFAYGQTGTGKTYTMQGHFSSSSSSSLGAEEGMQPRALRLLLKECQEASTSTISGSHSKIQRKLRVSIMEIYLDRVRDLLDNNHGTTQEKKLEVRQDQAKGNFVPGLTSKEIRSRLEMDALVAIAHKRRSQGATNINLHSSRSHLIVTVEVVSRYKATGETRHGRLHLVDLAGSERVSQSKVTGQQLKETLSINKSLSALGDVITARATESLKLQQQQQQQQRGALSADGSGNASQKDHQQPHVPYRNSTLTFLMQDALGGDSKVAFVLCVSPSASCAEETAASLSFASRASTVIQERANLKKSSAFSSSSITKHV